MLTESPQVTASANPTDRISESDTAVITSMIEQKALSHVAIIMDGNRRWAQSQNKPGIQGHYHGYQALKAILRDAGPVLSCL